MPRVMVGARLYCCQVQSHGDSCSLALGSLLQSVPNNFPPKCGNNKKLLSMTARETVLFSVFFCSAPSCQVSPFKNDFFFLLPCGFTFHYIYVCACSPKSLRLLNMENKHEMALTLGRGVYLLLRESQAWLVLLCC